MLRIMLEEDDRDWTGERNVRDGGKEIRYAQVKFPGRKVTANLMEECGHAPFPQINGIMREPGSD